MKKWLYSFHGWLGLNFGLVLFVVCLSGSIAVLSHEIDWLATPALRVAPTETRADWTTMTAAVRENYPEHTVRFANAPLGSRFAAEFIVSTPSGTTERVYVDPYQGTVTGRAPWFNTQRFFRDFHRRFFWYSWWGIWLVGIFGFMLLGSAATGIAFYKRWWTKLFILRFRHGLRVFISDLHRILGIWTLLFALVIAATGVWYVFEIPVGWMDWGDSAPPPRLSESNLDRLKSDPKQLPPGDWVRTARRTMPELDVRRIWFPQSDKQPARIEGQATAWFVRDRANQVFIDPYTGRVLQTQKAESLGALARWTDTADPLHFGTFGGLTSKLIWFAFGIALSALIPTGAFLWIRRRTQMIEGIVRQGLRRGNDPLEILATIRRRTRRRIAAGVISTLAIWYLAIDATWEALSKQLTDAGGEYGWRALGAPGAILVYGTFVLFVLAATLIWFRWVWLAPLPARMSSREVKAQPAVMGGGTRSRRDELWDTAAAEPMLMARSR